MWLHQGTVQAYWKWSNTRDETKTLTAILLLHLYTPQPQWKIMCCLGLECVSIDQESSRCYMLHQASVKPRWAENLTIFPEMLDLLFMNKVYAESWSSTSVLTSVVAATITLQNFSLPCFGASLPTLHNTLSCFVKYSSFSAFLAQRQPVDHSWSIPVIGCSPGLSPVVGWAASPWKLHISWGKPAFPPRITQSSLIAFWALGLCNHASQPSQHDLRKFSQQQAI